MGGWKNVCTCSYREPSEPGRSENRRNSLAVSGEFYGAVRALY